MFPNLLKMMAQRGLNDGDTGRIIGVSRTAFGRKMKTGSFRPDECRELCRYFGKPFDYLFALPGEAPCRENALR